MASARAPSERWNYQHGGRRSLRRAGYTGKICYPTRWAARLTVVKQVVRGLLRRRYRRVSRLRTYACRWGPDYRDGETAPLHWHVGHSRLQRRR